MHLRYYRPGMERRRWVSGFFKTFVATAVYAAVHSFFASGTAKQIARARFGARYRNGLYRPFYLVQSAVTMVFLVAYIKRQPSRMLFAYWGAASLPFRLLQVAGFCWAASAAYQVGLTEILGIRPALQLAAGSISVKPEPEAQGPAPDGNTMRVAGPFRWSRHPLNFAPFVIMWTNPRMTTNLLAFNLFSTIYLLLGSSHEQIRLEEAYGKAYLAYEDSGVPFYWPAPNRKS